jgi:haloalkane dehalogenase
VILDTAIDPREPWTSDSWVRFREFVEENEDFPVAEGMRATCFRDPGDEVVHAYEAPYPTIASKAALRGLPMSVPFKPDAAAFGGLQDALREDRRPMLVLWAEHDLFLTLASGQRLTSRIGRRIDHVIPEAGHALQEDQGPLIGRLIAEWLAR